MQKVRSSRKYSYGLIALIASASLFGTGNYVLSQTAQSSQKRSQTAFTIDFTSPYSGTQKTSRSQKKPDSTSKAKNQYSIITILEGETAHFIVKVYKENNQILYVGKSKKTRRNP
jgi:hypothetical protein